MMRALCLANQLPILKLDPPDEDDVELEPPPPPPRLGDRSYICGKADDRSASMRIIRPIRGAAE